MLIGHCKLFHYDHWYMSLLLNVSYIHAELEGWSSQIKYN